MQTGRKPSKPLPFSPLKLFRERAGMSQPELGELIEADKSTIAKWETGERAISKRYWAKLVEVLRPHGVTTIADLIGVPASIRDDWVDEMAIRSPLLTSDQKDSIRSLVRSMTEPPEHEKPSRRRTRR